MKKYQIVGEDIKAFITELDVALSQIEVKGDSVLFLSKARTMIKGLFDNVEYVGEIEEQEKEGG